MTAPEVPTIPRGKRVAGEYRAKVGRALAGAYTAGASLNDLCARTGRSYGFVHSILTEYGVQFRSRGHLKLPPDLHAEIARRYAAGGVTQAALGAEHGVSQSVVSRVVRSSRSATGGAKA